MANLQAAKNEVSSFLAKGAVSRKNATAQQNATQELDEEEYEELKKSNKYFYFIDEELASVWKQLSLIMDSTSKEKLLKDQLLWIRSRRQEQVARLVQDGAEKEKAYVTVTQERVGYLKKLLELYTSGNKEEKT